MSEVIKAKTKPRDVELMMFTGNNHEDIIDFVKQHVGINKFLQTTEFDYTAILRNEEARNAILEIEYRCRPYPVIEYDDVVTKKTKRVTIKQGSYLVIDDEDLFAVTKFDAASLYASELLCFDLDDVFEHLKKDEKLEPSKYDKIEKDQQKSYDDAVSLE